jgi:hypothetical protein
MDTYTHKAPAAVFGKGFLTIIQLRVLLDDLTYRPENNPDTFAKAIAASVYYESPAAMLLREGLGTSERSRYMDQLSHSGPAELRNFAQFAVATGNKLLAVAILNRMDRMRPNDRKALGFTRMQLASEIMSHEFESAWDCINIIKEAAKKKA